MENEIGIEETWTDWDSGGRSTQISMFIGIAVGAGLLLLILRRLFAKKATPAEDLIGSISDSAAALLGGQAGGAILPEMKPVLRAVLREIEASLVQGFKRADRAIDDL